MLKATRAILSMIGLVCFALSAHAQTNGVSKNTGSQRNTTKSQPKPAQDAQPTIPVAIQGAIDRIAAALEAQNAPENTSKANDRAERDVRAQEKIAKWAPKMFGLGAAEIFLTAIGVGLLYFTLRETRATARDTAEQVRLARRTYTSTNRPRLRVRKVEIDRPIVGHMIKVRYEVVNVGGTNAHIIDNDVTIRIRYMPHTWVMYHDGAGEVTGRRQFHFADDVRQGEALIAEGEILVFDAAWGFDATDSWWEDRLCVIGMIRYTDDNGVLRRTAFYRLASNDLNRFEFMPFSEAQKADLEYED